MSTITHIFPRNHCGSVFTEYLYSIGISPTQAAPFGLLSANGLKINPSTSGSSSLTIARCCWRMGSVSVQTGSEWFQFHIRAIDFMAPANKRLHLFKSFTAQTIPEFETRPEPMTINDNSGFWWVNGAAKSSDVKQRWRFGRRRQNKSSLLYCFKAVWLHSGVVIYYRIPESQRVPKYDVCFR